METSENPLMSQSAGALTQVVKDKKKKKKKKKLTPKERALERLEKGSAKIIDDSEQFNNLITTVCYWLKGKQKIAHKLLELQYSQTVDHELFLDTVKKKEDDENKQQEIDMGFLTEPDQIEPQPEPPNYENIVSYDDFKLVVSDLDIPCTNIQTHVICKLLDPNSIGKIDYKNFTPEFLNSLIRRHHMDGVRFITRTEQTKHLKNFTFKKELTKHFASSSPSYIKLDLRHITFAGDKEFRGHVKEEIVNISTKVVSLIELLKDRLDIASYKISIYTDVTKSKVSYLDENRTLQSYGFNGAAYNDVVQSQDKIILYFDYWILKDNDPILNCDFYFNDYKFKK